MWVRNFRVVNLGVLNNIHEANKASCVTRMLQYWQEIMSDQNVIIESTIANQIGTDTFNNQSIQ